MIAGVILLLLSCYGWWYYAFVMSDTKTFLGAAIFGVGGILLCVLALIRRTKHQDPET